MEFESVAKVVIEQRGKAVFLRMEAAPDSGHPSVEVRLGASETVELATKLLAEAQKAAWHAG